MQRAARLDANHKEIEYALTLSGAVVISLAQLKNRCDMLVGHKGKLYLMEIKSFEIPKRIEITDQWLKKKLTAGEREFLSLMDLFDVKVSIPYDRRTALSVIGEDTEKNKWILDLPFPQLERIGKRRIAYLKKYARSQIFNN